MLIVMRPKGPLYTIVLQCTGGKGFQKQNDLKPYPETIQVSSRLEPKKYILAYTNICRTLYLSKVRKNIRKDPVIFSTHLFCLSLCGADHQTAAAPPPPASEQTHSSGFTDVVLSLTCEPSHRVVDSRSVLVVQNANASRTKRTDSVNNETAQSGCGSVCVCINVQYRSAKQQPYRVHTNVLHMRPQKEIRGVCKVAKCTLIHTHKLRTETIRSSYAATAAAAAAATAAASYRRSNRERNL